MCGLVVEVLQMSRRPTGPVTVLEPAADGRGQKVPAWMLSPAARSVTWSDRLVISTDAMASLTTLLAAHWAESCSWEPDPRGAGVKEAGTRGTTSLGSESAAGTRTTDSTRVIAPATAGGFNGKRNTRWDSE